MRWMLAIVVIALWYMWIKPFAVLKTSKEILKRDQFIENWLNYHSKNNLFKFSFINRHGTIKMLIQFIKKKFIKNITSNHFSF